MKIARRFTSANHNVYDSVEWTTRSSRITNADGSLVFEMNDAEVPESWSQLATDIVVSKYFRKAGVPQLDDNGQPILDDAGTPVTGPERSVKQIVNRLAGCWRHWGERYGYFSSSDDAQAFEDEIAYMLLHQVAAPNSPQWFNTGLNWAYGISGPPQGHWIANHATGEISLANDAYTHPQPHACFIQSVRDDLVGEGGIMDLWTREARLFKYGSGTGTNFSSIRGEGEPLSGGGRSSGLMSFLKIGDRAAGAIKSGGTTRRAAKMVCLDVDHPDIEQFIDWKVREELKVAALVEGMKHLPEEQVEAANSMGLRLDYDFNGEAYFTVSGQNSNNSVRISDTFFEAVEQNKDWSYISRIDGSVVGTIPAQDLWNKVCYAAWKCADPGVQFDSTINAWHTCPEGGRINASNPCSEYMFLDDTACNLASINLLKFFDADTKTFDIDGYEHAIGLLTMVLEISVLMASFPSQRIAELSWKYRTLGLGYANLGAMLMQAGVPYDSESGRAICGALTAVLTGRSYAASAKLAGELGTFDGYAENREDMLRVIRNHQQAAHGVERNAGHYDDLRIDPMPINHEALQNASQALSNCDELLNRATGAWDDALEFGEKYGYRNAQVSVIAPTGTIGLLMDCDTTGVEPDFALVKFKKLAGGGYFKIANQSLRPSLASIGYSAEEIDLIVTHVMGSLNLGARMPAEDGSKQDDGPTFHDWLKNKGYSGDDLVALENVLPTVFEIGFAFTAWSMPQDVLASLNIEVETARNNPAFNGLVALGLTRAQISTLNRLICGTQTVEGAPGLKDEHLPIFDCANTCGPLGKRFIRPEGHIRMMAAAQSFISGAISKTINLPHEATVEQIADSYRLSWELGLKANALYRDGCKLSQPLNSTSDEHEEVSDDEALEANGATEAAEAMLEESLKEAQVKTQVIERVVERIIERPMRRRLPDTRQSLTHKFNVAGHEGYLIVGLYEDNSPGELFITMAKEGSTIGGLMDSLGTAISVALQYGVPVNSLVNKFAHQRFEPMGMTANSDIPFAKSLVDYIFRWLGLQFVEGYREQNLPRRPAATATKEESCNSTDATSRLKPATSVDTTSGSEKITRTDLSESAKEKTEDPISPGTPETAMGDAPEILEATMPSSGNERNPLLNDPETLKNVLNQSNALLMGDAPACEVCGSITIRNGTCYRCLNCGNSMGCS